MVVSINIQGEHIPDVIDAFNKAREWILTIIKYKRFIKEFDEDYDIAARRLSTINQYLKQIKKGAIS